MLERTIKRRMFQEAYHILAWHKGAACTCDGHEICHRPTVDRDLKPFAGLHFTQDPANVVSQLTL